jgi:hypothetical protein
MKDLYREQSWGQENRVRREEIPMSLSAFVAGVALGGLRYGAVKYQLLERESVVLYSVNQVKESFHGDAHVRPRIPSVSITPSAHKTS